MAAASAVRSSGAAPRYWARCRRIETRQERSLAAMAFFLGDRSTSHSTARTGKKRRGVALHLGGPEQSNFVPPVCPRRALAVAKGRRAALCGQPFHCRAVVRLNYRKDAVYRRPGAPWRQGSSSRMPATAAIDNETLDHLLSITDLALAALRGPQLRCFQLFVKAATAGRYLAGARRGLMSCPPASYRWPQYSIRPGCVTPGQAHDLACPAGAKAPFDPQRQFSKLSSHAGARGLNQAPAYDLSQLICMG